MTPITILGLNIDLISAGVGAGVIIVGVAIGFGLSKIKRKRQKPTFAEIKTKLNKAYEGNRTSAMEINELYKMFDEVEQEVKKLQ